MVKRRITRTTPCDSQGTLVFWYQNSLVDDHPFRWNLRSKWPTPLSNSTISTNSASTVKAGEKSSISANRKSTTRFRMSHRWTVYVTPKSPNGWHKTWFCYIFPTNFNFCRKKSATKFLCVKTSSGKVVATSFFYVTVHRWIVGNVPIYQKISGVDPSVFRVFEQPHNFGGWCSPVSDHPQIFPENMCFLPVNCLHLQSIYLLTWRLKQCLLLFTV